MQPFKFWKMFQTISLIALMFGLVLWPGPALAQAESDLMFIENVGQFPASGGGEAIRFQVRGSQVTLSLTDEALWLTLLDKSPEAQSPTSTLQPPTSLPQRGVNLKLSFADANPQPGLEPFDRLDTHVSFFAGSNPADWHPDVPVWGGVRYVDLYPGIDLEVSSQNGQLVQRWVIKEDVAAQSSPDSNPLANIHWQIEGADAISLDNNQLQLSTNIGQFNLPLPQLVAADGAPLDLSATPEVNGQEITSPFSTAAPLLDSLAHTAAAADLIYSTYLGGSVSETGWAIAVDNAGSAYIGGSTTSIDFPTTPGAFDTSTNTMFAQAFVVKLNPSGSTPEYATFLGGAAGETIYGIAVDETGHAYAIGETRSFNFPTTPGAFAPSISGTTDAFITKFNPTGTELVYSTFLGSTNLDGGRAIAVDSAGSAYVTGITTGPGFPTTPGAFDSTFNHTTLGAHDIFVARLNPDGSALEYGTYLGSSGEDDGAAIAIDAAGNAYVAGQTESTNFPTTPGAFQTSFHRSFVTKLNPSGSALVYSTFLGGNGVDVARGVAVDEEGHAFVAGDTTSNNFPTTPGAFQTTYHTGSTVTRDGDLFVVKLNSDGSGLVYGTYIGGFDHDVGFALALDPLGRAYVTGGTYSVDFPTTPNAFQPTPPGYPDAFVARLNTAGSALTYSSYLGGTTAGESGYAIAADPSGSAYITGYTGSSDFPTTAGAFDTSISIGQDAFVTRLATGNEPEPPPTVPSHSCAPTSLGTVNVGNEPRGLALDPVRQRLYVANFAGHSVSVVNTSSNTLIQTISGITSANSIAFDPSHNLIWVSNYSANRVTPIQANADASSFTVLPALTTGSGPWGVAYDPVHDFVYVANSQGNSVTVINATSRTVTATLTGSFNRPFHLAANSVTGKVYVSNYGSHSVTVLNGASISRVIDLYDSIQPYGIAVDETRNLVYVATVGPHRIVVIGPIRGVPDQFYGWAAFNRGFGNPRRPLPLRMVAINPAIGPTGDGGHVWATTATSDGSETNQALFIPKGWGGYFHFPFAQNVTDHPTDGLAIDRVTNRVYVSSGTSPGTVTVAGDHATLCSDAYAHIASLEEGTPPAEDADQIGVEIFDNTQKDSQPRTDLNSDSLTNILDLAIVATHYGSSDPAADLNADGQVNILDLAIVAKFYQQ